MAQTTRGGMYCMSCDKPVAATKTTHGVRNLLAVPTVLLTAKVEDWHCPDCGGAVVDVQTAQRRKVNAAIQQAEEADLVREVRDATGVIVQPAKKTFRLASALNSAGSGLTNKDTAVLIQQVKDGQAITVVPKEWFWLRGFVRKLKKLGCEYELVRYEGVAPPADEDSDPAAGPPSQPPASEEQTDEVLAQVEKLGELHQAGILTDEEFQSKRSSFLVACKGPGRETHAGPALDEKRRFLTNRLKWRY